MAELFCLGFGPVARISFGALRQPSVILFEIIDWKARLVVEEER